MAVQTDQVRDDILVRILCRDLLPGDRIDETDLRNRLELSGTPVREALISLEAVGVVERRPRGGARIVSLDLGGLIKMNEALAEAEGAVAYRAARRINPNQAEALKQTAQACRDFAESDKQSDLDYFDLNLKFHETLLSASGNKHLNEAVYLAANRLVGYLHARHNLPGEALQSAKEHLAICDAVLDHNCSLARDLMIEHVTFSDTLALDVMNALRPPVD